MSGLWGLICRTVLLRNRMSFRDLTIAGTVILLLISSTWPALAKYASVVIDAETGRVYHETNADTRNYPASLTKMMTLYMLFEQVEQGEMTLKSKLKVSARASRQPSSKMWLAPGSKISAEDAILGLVVRSANDVAVVVAEHLGKTERGFAKQMTKKAKALGMTQTNFRNASGLPNRSQLSTARDMAILSQRLMNDFPQFYSYFARTKFTYDGKTFRGHNKFMSRYAGADGLKTGYINASGFNLAGSAKRDGIRLIGVVFGGKSAKQRDAHLATLMDKGFAVAAEYGRPPYPARKPLMMAETDGSLVPAGITIKPRGKPDVDVLRSEAWGIQIGAYSISDIAQQKANEAAVAVKKIFIAAFGRIEPVTVSGKQLFRAQIMGLTEADTQKACEIMERAPHQCLIVAPEYAGLASLGQPG
jgi:D-alanyl-D-alanine carboxypeptidase